MTGGTVHGSGETPVGERPVWLTDTKSPTPAGDGPVLAVLAVESMVTLESSGETPALVPVQVP
jgi:hypothetical protein